VSENVVLRVDEHPLQSYTPSEATDTCEKCGATLYVGSWPFCPHTQNVSLVASKIYPFTTKHFNGKEIEVTSRAHEKALCQEYGVHKRDDVAWNEKRYLGYNPLTKQQEYKEGNGCGLPGCWV